MIELIEAVKGGAPCAHVAGLPAGAYCRVYPSTNIHLQGWYERKTCNGAKAGIRYAQFPGYREAIEAALKWANRKYG